MTYFVSWARKFQLQHWRSRPHSSQMNSCIPCFLLILSLLLFFLSDYKSRLVMVEQQTRCDATKTNLIRLRTAWNVERVSSCWAIDLRSSQCRCIVRDHVESVDSRSFETPKDRLVIRGGRLRSPIQMSFVSIRSQNRFSRHFRDLQFLDVLVGFVLNNFIVRPFTFFQIVNRCHFFRNSRHCDAVESQRIELRVVMQHVINWRGNWFGSGSECSALGS